MMKKIKLLKPKTRHSLTRQITFVFVAIMALTVGACLLVNNVFLEKYYTHSKVETLLSVYDSLDSASRGGYVSSEYFDLELQKTSATHNVSIAIITSLFKPVKVYASESHDVLMQEIRSNLSGTITANAVILQEENYILINTTDSVTNLPYLEMLGNLSDGSFFLLRVPLESIKNSAAISNRFLLYTGIGGIIISGIIIFFFTRRFSKPVLELARISKRMADMDFEAKYTGKDKTEIAVLGNSINEMSENLKRSIGELKEANEQLRKDNELMARVDEMRKDFISNVSHELKTPIALIQGYAEGLKEVADEKEEREYYCDVIIDESSKMNSMVRKLLTLNQLEYCDDVISKEHFDIMALINNYIQSAEIITKPNNIAVRVFGPQSQEVFADEFMIEEVFMNFFTNACNHCESLTKKRIDVSVEKRENIVRVTVFNTGNPIPEEAVPHLFEKFFKVDKARTREYGGSGVGLSIVKAIMDAHGREYGVFNEEDGVGFYFTLDIS